MLQKRKKGFTIVELVVVIAVVAVLAAVLIPTFANIVKKAKISNDTVLVKNLNTALVTSAAIDGTPKTMHEVLARVAENGYNVDKLTPTSTGDILWDQNTNRFVLKDGDTVVFAEDASKASDNYALWKITKSASEVESGKYSYYLDNGFTGATTLNVKNGIDTGSNTGLTITLANPDAVTLITRTNAGNSLTVDAAQATVYHYGELNNLNITAVASASYHEHGTIKGNVTLTKGRFVAENSSSVAAIVLTPAAVADVKVVVESQAVVNTVVAGNEAGKTVIEDSDTIPANIKKTEILTPDQIETISKFAGGLGTKEAPYLISNEAHWDSLKEMSSQDYTSTAGKYFSVITDLNFIDNDTDYRPTLMYFSGHINFNNKNVYMPEYVLPNPPRYRTLINNVSGTVTIESLNYYANNAIMGATEATSIIGYIGKDQTANILFKNINSYGNLNLATNNCGVYIYYPANGNTGSVISFDNCDNYCNIVNTGYTGIYCAVIYKENFEITLNFKDCDNYATVISGEGAAMFLSNPTCYNNNKLNLSVENCKNYGQLLTGNGRIPTLAINQSTNGERVFISKDDAQLLETTGKVVNSGDGMSINSNKTEISITQDGYFDFESIKQDEAKKYEITFGFNGVSGRGGGVASYKFVFDNDTLRNMKCLPWMNNDEYTTNPLYDSTGNTYYLTEENYIFALGEEEKDYNMNKQPIVTLLVYDGNGKIINVYTYKYPVT